MHNGLERLAQLDDDELDALIKLAQMQSGGVSRRDALKGAGAVGLGALLGGGATGAASAQASETDSDPNVGSPSNRVDVFSDGVDANVVSADSSSTADVIIGPSDDLNDAQTRLDNEGSNTTVWFETGSYTMGQALSFYDNTTVYALGCTFTNASGSNTNQFQNEDFATGNTGITFVLYGSVLDGNVASFTAGDNPIYSGIRLAGDSDDSDTLSEFASQMRVYGGELKNFPTHGIWLDRVIDATVEDVYAHNNRKPDGTASDGVYAATCRDVVYRGCLAEGNARNGLTFAGTNSDSCVECSMENVTGRDNALSNLRVEQCAGYSVDGRSINAGGASGTSHGVYLSGYGEADVTSRNDGGNGVLINVVSYGLSLTVAEESRSYTGMALDAEVTSAAQDDATLAGISFDTSGNFAGSRPANISVDLQDCPGPGIEILDGFPKITGIIASVGDEAVTASAGLVRLDALHIRGEDQNGGGAAAVSLSGVNNGCILSGVTTEGGVVEITSGDYHYVDGSTTGAANTISGANSTNNLV